MSQGRKMGKHLVLEQVELKEDGGITLHFKLGIVEFQVRLEDDGKKQFDHLITEIAGPTTHSYWKWFFEEIKKFWSSNTEERRIKG